MARDIYDIIADLELFRIEGDYLLRLKELTDELVLTGNPDPALIAMLNILEKYPDEELGSPGPLLFAIKKCQGYEDELVKSITRQPSTLTVWAVFQLAKQKREKKYIDALKSVEIHKTASEQIKEDAALLLSWLDNG